MFSSSMLEGAGIEDLFTVVGLMVGDAWLKHNYNFETFPSVCENYKKNCDSS